MEGLNEMLSSAQGVASTLDTTLLSVFNQAPAAVAILDGPNHVYSFVNPLYRSIFGRGDKEFVGRTLREVFPEVEGQGLYEIFNSVYDTGTPFTADEFFVSFFNEGVPSNGYFNFTIQPLKNDALATIGVMVHAFEVTKYVNSRLKVKESETELEAIANALPVLIAYVDKDLRYRFTNTAYYNWFGFTKTQLRGSTMEFVLGKEAFAALKPTIEKAKAGEVASYEGFVDYARAGRRYIAANYIPHINSDNVIQGIYVIVSDLSDRKTAEQKLAASENRFRHLIQSNIIGVIFWDTDGGILDANDAFLSRFGYTREDIGKGLRWTDLTPPQWKEKDIKGVEDILERGHHMPYEKQYYHKDGSAVDVIIGSSAFIETNNRQGVTFVLDISEHKKAERILKESESRYKSIYQSEQIGLVFVNTNGVIAEANDAFLNMIGYSREALEQGKIRVEEITPPEFTYLDAQCAEQLMQRGEAKPYEKQYYYSESSDRRVDVWIGGISLMEGKSDLVVACVLDISTRKATERALKQSEERFAAAVRALEGVLWTNNAEGKMEGEQAGWEELTGQRYEEYQGYGWANVVHPEDALPTVDGWNKAVQERRVFEFEHRLRVRDGSYRLFSIRSIPIMNNDGTIREWVGVHTDITEQRQSQEKIKKAEEKVRFALEAAHMVAWELDIRTNKVYRSSNAKDFLGFESSAGVDFMSLIHPDDNIRVHKSLKEVLSGGAAYEQEFRLLKPDGSVVWVFDKAQLVKDPTGAPIALTGVLMDITKRKQAEEEQEKLNIALLNSTAMLSRERERLSIALRTGGMGVYEWHLGEEKVWWSPELYQLFGVNEDTFSPTIEAFSALIHPDDREMVWKLTNESVEQMTEFKHEYRIIRGDGEVRWHLNISSVSKNSAGVIELTGVAVDITERKLIEERLENLVRERTKDLQRSNEDLQQFAHVASHDLKEPVRKIKTFSNRLEHEFADALGARGIQYLEKIQRSTDRMATMIEGVLNYSLVNAESVSFEEVDLNLVLNNIAADLEVIIDETATRIHYEGLPKIKGIPVLLYQLFYNLINNSIKFRQASIAPLIEITSSRFMNGKRLRIEVKDNGIGFESKHASRVFETFTRLNSKDQYEGTGLGLALVRKIVERHNGNIYAVSEVGVGTTFIIDIPVA